MELPERLSQFLHKDPRIAGNAYIASSAELIGDVRIGHLASIWPKCVLRADINYIEIGEGSNIQDGTVIHLSDDYPVTIGKYTTVGHSCIIHACTIGDECLIGMGSTILDGAVIGKNCIIGANALIPKGMEVSEGSLVLGIPGKVVKNLNPKDRSDIIYWAKKYIQLAEAHKEKFG